MSTVDAWVEYFKNSTNKKDFDIVSHPINRSVEVETANYISTRIGKKCVIVPPNRWVNTEWAHFSLMEATILSMYHIHTTLNYRKIILVDASTMPLYTNSDKIHKILRDVEGSHMQVSGGQWVTLDKPYVSEMFSKMKPTERMVNKQHVAIINGSEPHYGYQWLIINDRSSIAKFLNDVFNKGTYELYGLIDEKFFQTLYRKFRIAGSTHIKLVHKNKLSMLINDDVKIKGELPAQLFNSLYMRTISKRETDTKNHKLIIKDVLKSNIVETWEEYNKNIQKVHDKTSNLSCTFTDWSHFQLNFNNLVRFDKSVPNYKVTRARVLKNLKNEFETASESQIVGLWTDIFSITMMPFWHPLEYISTDTNKCSISESSEQKCSARICSLLHNLIRVLGNRAYVDADGYMFNTSNKIDTLISDMSKTLDTTNGLRRVNAFKVMFTYLFVVCYYGKGGKIFDLHKNTILVAKRTTALFIRKVNSNRRHVHNVLMESNHDMKKFFVDINTPNILNVNIRHETITNQDYRKILYTDVNMQVVLMSLPAGQHIPEETHVGSQFIRVELGAGWAIIGDIKIMLDEGIAVTIPPNVKHYIHSTSGLKLYTIYSPPQH